MPITLRMETPSHRAPSRLWTVSVVALVALAAAAATAALVYQQRASRPVGEGELFAAEAAAAAGSYGELLAEGIDPATAVRAVRNDLRIEAVGLVVDGSYREASAPELVGTAVPELLAGALTESRLAAAALPVPVPISIDGVVEWEARSVVYQVAQPLQAGSGLVLSYDVSELLARRARS